MCIHKVASYASFDGTRNTIYIKAAGSLQILSDLTHRGADSVRYVRPRPEGERERRGAIQRGRGESGTRTYSGSVVAHETAV